MVWINYGDSFEDIFIKLFYLINFVAHLNWGSYGVSIILLSREICFDKIVCVKCILPLLGWCLQWEMAGQWYGAFFCWWHTCCVIRSAQSVYSLSVFIPILERLVLRIAQRDFSHGCQFKSRLFGFPERCPQNFLRSGILGLFLCAF